MEQRLANAWHVTLIEKNFIETALRSNLRVDGRGPLDYRGLTINFAREDGSSEVQLGQTHVMGFVSAQLVRPYLDRPNEGSLAIYTEFSPMADPLFEAGRPGECAVELGRVVDRGLRESRAVDTESLCVLAGKLVWSIRVDLHILDNGGNLVDAANIAALVALMTFRRPECTLGGEDGQDVIVQPPEVREPLPLIIHHLPIAITYAFISDDDTAVIDPTHFEEAIMRGRMTVTVNATGDVCAIQKAGGVGVKHNIIMQCLRVACEKAVDITREIRNTVKMYNTQRAHQKIKHHCPSDVLIVDLPCSAFKEDKPQCFPEERGTRYPMDKSTHLKLYSSESKDMDAEQSSSTQRSGMSRKGDSSIKGPSRWDPYTTGLALDLLKVSLGSCDGKLVPKVQGNKEDGRGQQSEIHHEPEKEETLLPSFINASGMRSTTSGVKTLKDAVKPKNKRKQKVSSTAS